MVPHPLRIVSFNIMPRAYAMVANWAAARGHEIVLVVTTPGSHETRYGVAHTALLEAVPATRDILVTGRMRRTAAPVIGALAPDLIISATFPRRIPPSVTSIPRYGAVNLHPAPLPLGRGPNPLRLIYEGHPTIGASLHRIEPELDAGPVLSLQERPVPANLTPQLILSTWTELLTAALDEGVPRTVAGDMGAPQDTGLTTYAAPFSDEELWLDWNEPAVRLQQRVATLNFFVPRARSWLASEQEIIHTLRPLPTPTTDVAPGAVVERSGNLAIVQAGDGLVEVTVGVGGAT